jgi:hypothetical protein
MSSTACTFGSYSLGAPTATEKSDEVSIAVIPDFTVTAEMATFLRRAGRSIEGVSCGCSNKFGSRFSVLLDANTDVTVVHELMQRLSAFAPDQLYSQPAYADSDVLYPPRGRE